MLRLVEIWGQGEATSSTVNILVLARDSTLGATLSNGTPGAGVGALSSGAPAVRATTFDTATTKPQRATTLKLLPVSFNAFGGILRWVPAPGSEIYQVGNAVNVGETSLSAYTGSGAGQMSSSVSFEEL